ncbi:uncharacterized protein LOC133836647 [Drosophila sulfurigaster albostrigata]|uniref:uncharacterized protein LOC133836647 n=1 Tax=Drosophila sulfurigaster albostrigata TaxID=89887 RepID=UPI002D2199A1|nr:uncharacterized protein LOC133836647 [Drosophila sulfurigaster albostrigata]
MPSVNMFNHLCLMRASSILLLLQLISCISMGAAIKCYVCDSSDNPSCADLKSNSSIESVNCTLHQMKSLDTWLFDLNKVAFFNNGANKEPIMNCQKVVARDPHTHKLVTARFCQLDTADSDACEILRHKLSIPKDGNREQRRPERDQQQQQRRKGYGHDDGQDVSPADEFFCDICNKNNCNGADAVTLTTYTAIAGMFVLQQLLTGPLLGC